jgi:membrane dipeptidase
VSAAALHADALVCNLHDDWSIEVQRAFLRGDRGALERTYAPRMREGGIDFTFYTVGGDDVMFTQDPDLLLGTLRAIDGALTEIDASATFELCCTAAEVAAARARGRIGLMFTIEGAGPVGEDLSVLRNLHRLGLRSLILTWFKANAAGDGVGEARNGGLTTFGRELVQELNRLGVIIDVTQSAPATVADVLARSEQPVIASHSNCCGVHPHVRNLTDDQLEGIAAGGGVVGITCYPAHVGANGVTLERFLDHVDYAVGRIGIDHVGVGLNLVVHSRDEAREFYERSSIDYTAFELPGLEDLDRMPAVTAGLLSRGYDAHALRQIMGGNLLRVIESVTGA